MIASVVIPTFNKKERLTLTLESFKYQTVDKEEFEVIIVDDGSDDGTSEMILRGEFKFNLTYLKKNNRGRSAARNEGIQAARGEIIIFCDDDLIIGPNFIKEHIDAHQGNKNRVVHGLIYNLPYLKFFKNPETGETYEKVEKDQLTMLQTYTIKKEDIKNIDVIHGQSKMTRLEKIIKEIAKEDINELKWLYFTGGNVSCNKKLLEEVECFDIGFGKGWGSEDFEIGYKLYQRNAHFIYAAQAYNYHMMHARKTFKRELEISISKFYELHQDPYIYHLAKLLNGEIKGVKKYLEYIKEGIKENG